MAFSCKIILAEHLKEDGTRQVYLQAIIDRMRAKIPLGFYVQENSFDKKRQCMKPDHANAKNYDAEFIQAIASKFRLEDIPLTPSSFKNEFNNPTDRLDLIRFIKNEREFKRPKIAHGTYKQHGTAINKLEAFKKRIAFKEISIELFQQFENFLIKEYNNSLPTIHKLLGIIKQYMSDAQNKGMKFKDPFEVIKIRSFRTNRLGLSQFEVNRLDEYYDKQETDPSHKKVLRYFLFSCYTGVRISDIKLITWNNIHDDLLIFKPEKTKSHQKIVSVPLISLDKKYLPEASKGTIFDTYADQVTNRYLKEIAREVGIKKKVTYHMSRHTFGSLFAEGGNIIALQKMMGHGDIKTTMGYVHTNTQNLIDAKKERFGS